MNLSIGAAGFNYPEWVGEFYPEDMPQEWVVDYYANEIDCVLLCHEELADKNLLAACMKELDESFYLLVEDSDKVRTNLNDMQGQGSPVVGYCAFDIGESQRVGNFVIDSATIKFANGNIENALALLVSSEENANNQDLKSLLSHIHNVYYTYSMVLVFFDGVICRASIVKLAQTTNDLMG